MRKNYKDILDNRKKIVIEFNRRTDLLNEAEKKDYEFYCMLGESEEECKSL